MTKLSIGTLMLKLRLAVLRLDLIGCIALLLCTAGLACWVLLVPQLRSQIDERQRTLHRLQLKFDAPTELAVRPSPASAAERLEQFYDALGEKDYAEQQVKVLFAIADKSGLRLDQAEYRWAFDKDGRFYSYQIVLPVKGPYATIRTFCEQVLLSIPFASLDEIGFRRDAITSSNLEAKLRLTLFFAEPAVLTRSKIIPGE